MNILAVIIISLAIFLFIAVELQGKKSVIQIMLLGIEITVIGGILAIDPDSSIEGFEYAIILFGLGVTIIGLTKDGKEQ